MRYIYDLAEIDTLSISEFVKCSGEVSGVTTSGFSITYRSYQEVGRKELAQLLNLEIVVDGITLVFDHIEAEKETDHDWGFDGYDERVMEYSTAHIVIYFKDKETK